MKSGTCPKCRSTRVYSGTRIFPKSGPFGSNSIPVSLTSIGRAGEIPALGARVTPREYRDALAAAREEGITRLDPPRRVFALV